MRINFEDLKDSYTDKWTSAKVNDSKESQIESACQRLLAHKDTYQTVEDRTGVPGFMIGALHYREASFNFNTHLHNGDPLKRRTTHVPKGRPKAGSPPFTWEESAIDALTMPPHSLDQVDDWSIERILYEIEKYNGFGYYNKGRVSPYVWSGTNLYKSGKYVADGRYDDNFKDSQLGCACILMKLIELDDDVKKRIGKEDTPAEDTDAKVTKTSDEVADNSTPTSIANTASGEDTATVASAMNGLISSDVVENVANHAVTNVTSSAKSAFKSKTVWSQIAAIGTTVVAFVQTHHVMFAIALAALAALGALVIYDRLKRSDIKKGSLLTRIFG